MTESVDKKEQSNNETSEDQRALGADGDIDTELLEELEPDEEAENEADKSDDFFYDDPADLDEPDQLRMGESEEVDDNETDGIRDKEEEETTEEIKDDLEAVELDEPEEELKEDDPASGTGANEEVSGGGEEQGAQQAESSSTGKRVSFFKKNRILISVFVVGMMFVGAGFFLGTRVGSNKDEGQTKAETPVVTNQIIHEKLTPFFVPLGRGNDDALMAKIDFMVSWSRICSIRFRQARHEIRSEVYSFLQGLLAKGVSTKTDKSLIKEGATKVLNSALGVTTVKVSGMDIELI